MLRLVATKILAVTFLTDAPHKLAFLRVWYFRLRNVAIAAAMRRATAAITAIATACAFFSFHCGGYRYAQNKQHACSNQQYFKPLHVFSPLQILLALHSLKAIFRCENQSLPQGKNRTYFFAKVAVDFLPNLPLLRSVINVATVAATASHTNNVHHQLPTVYTIAPTT